MGSIFWEGEGSMLSLKLRAIWIRHERSSSMSLTFLILITFFKIQTLPLSVFAELPEPTQEVSINEFSQKIFQAEVNELPLFLQDWLRQKIDKNQDQKINWQEQSYANQELNQALKRSGIQAMSEVVDGGGRVHWLEFLAGNKDLQDGNKLRLSIGSRRTG